MNNKFKKYIFNKFFKSESIELIQTTSKHVKRKLLKNELEPLNSKELKAWLNQKATRKIILILKKMKFRIAEDLIKNADAYKELSRPIGRCEGIDAVIEILENANQTEENLADLLDQYFYNIYEPNNMSNEHLQS